MTLDTLRYDALAEVEGRPSQMPSLREWAAGSTNFVRFFTSTSTTQPSHASMLTGLHPWQHGVTRNGQPLLEEYTTVAELLRATGFATTAVVASFPVSSTFGFDQGFDLFMEDFERGKVERGWLSTESSQDRQVIRRRPFYSLAKTITESAVTALDSTNGSRQFFWFHYFDPHDPYGDSRKGKRRNAKDPLRLVARGKDPSAALREARELYDLDVAYLDRWLRILLDRLDRDSDEFENHVVVVGDHGESFGEEGSVAHGSRLTPEQIQVPCVIRSSKIEPGLRTDPAGSTDVFATLLSLAGVERSSNGGRDLTTPSRNARVFGMRRVYAPKQHVRRLDGKRYPVDYPWFYIVTRDDVLVRGNSQTILAPPEDLRLQSQTAQTRIKKLFEILENELEGSFRQEELDEETIHVLKALGYVQ